MPKNSSSFDIVRFSKKTLQADIGKELSSIPKQTQIASLGLVTDLTKQTGQLIASPPLPPINANVNSVVVPLNDLAKNPAGVIKTSLKTSLGRQGQQLRTGLLQLKSTLKFGIRNCLRNSILTLTNKLPNIPFGGVDIRINKKLNDLLGMQLKLGVDLLNRRITLQVSLNKSLDSLKSFKSLNFMTGKLQGEINKEINNICNSISPRNKKGFANNRYMASYVDTQVLKVMDCIENKVVKAAGGFDITAPADFFDKVTGKLLDPTAEATGKLDTTLNKIGGVVSGTIDSVDSAIAKTAGKIQSVLIPIGTTATKAVDSINNAINSNVAKLIPNPDDCK